MSIPLPHEVPNLDANKIENVIQILLNAPSTSLPKLTSGTINNGPANNYNDLLIKARRSLDTWSTKDRAAFVHGHPRIGAIQGLEGLSKQEQSDKGCSPGVIEKLSRLNDEYEKLLPELRYITFVAGRSREDLIPEFEYIVEQVRSGKRNFDSELERALDEIFKIAMDRARKMSSAVPLARSPITTHVLDTSTGIPAQGIHVTLSGPEIGSVSGITNQDGRIGTLLSPNHKLAPGDYVVHFKTGAYHESQGLSPFFSFVEVNFKVSNPPSDHYHIPLLLSPYSYSTYRGS